MLVRAVFLHFHFWDFLSTSQTCLQCRSPRRPFLRNWAGNIDVEGSVGKKKDTGMGMQEGVVLRHLLLPVCPFVPLGRQPLSWFVVVERRFAEEMWRWLL